MSFTIVRGWQLSQEWNEWGEAMIDARVQQNMTQKDLSAKTGITQADISRIENGTRNPSLSMVKKLAQGLGMQLKLEFVPMPTKNKM